MTKRSHQIASRQAAISRERKKRKKSHAGEKQVGSSATPTAIDVATNHASTIPTAVRAPVQSVSVKSSQSVQLDDSRYQYVVKDLRQITIIAIPLIVILIILAFVL